MSNSNQEMSTPNVPACPSTISVQELQEDLPTLSSSGQTIIPQGGLNPKNSKFEYRKEVWKYLTVNNLVTDPRPAQKRIPNFKGSEDACLKLADLEVFKKAQNVLVSPDKAQQYARILTLEMRKNLFVPLPQISSDFMMQITPADNFEPVTTEELAHLVSHKGLESGKKVDLDAPPKIDIFIVGSVAISKKGQRIGKGRGFVDMEYGILRQIGAIDEKTPIVTVVHDCQVYDIMPDSIFGPHDAYVNFIVTPTQIIEVSDPPSNPQGIIWPCLAQEQIDIIPVLQKLKEKDLSKGNEVNLRVMDESEKRYFRRPKYIRHGRKFNRNKNPGADTSPENGPGTSRRHGKNNRARRERHASEGANLSATENGEGDVVRKRRFSRGRSKNKVKPSTHFLLLISNIDKSIKKRVILDALAKVNVVADDSSWDTRKGFYYLHFAKTANGDQPFALEDIIRGLQDIEGSLDVEMWHYHSKIVTTNVTSV